MQDPKQTSFFTVIAVIIGVFIRKRERVSGVKAGILEELQGGKYQFTYFDDYHGELISLTMPLTKKIYDFATDTRIGRYAIVYRKNITALINAAKPKHQNTHLCG